MGGAKILPKRLFLFRFISIAGALICQNLKVSLPSAGKVSEFGIGIPSLSNSSKCEVVIEVGSWSR